MIIGIRFEPTGTIFYYDTKYKFKVKQEVVVQVGGERKFGYVVSVNPDMTNEFLEEQPAKIYAATDQDRQRLATNIVEAKEAKKIGKEKIHLHGLEMKLTHVAYTFDRSKLIFYFTADGRIDFRELVKDLAACFKTRIELRQIGVRDEAKILGGLGPCGRQLCCTSFLGDFVPVSIKMAKDQGLSLNPIKISGLCGRLMCCLQYEQEEYELAKKEVPDWGTTVKTPDGIGRVEGVNLLSRIVRVKLKESFAEYLTSEIEVVR